MFVVFGLLGVTWSSIQWLVAAIGVGLGFRPAGDLRERVSGLLLLVERPVRIGDTITVGRVTGAVTKIRIRATIQDRDSKELVVPHKDLVTGHLLNWTLSDAANRVTVVVGVAYDSDADQVTRVLRETVSAEPLVLEAPAPRVTFEEFGDSALKFSIRAFVQDVEERLPAIHALHTAIARRFRDEGIEIAFPQMDVQVRSTVPLPRDESAWPLRVAGTSGWAIARGSGSGSAPSTPCLHRSAPAFAATPRPGRKHATRWNRVAELVALRTGTPPARPDVCAPVGPSWPRTGN